MQEFKGYVFENATLSQDGKTLDVLIRPRRGASATCGNTTFVACDFTRLDACREGGHEFASPSLVSFENDCEVPVVSFRFAVVACR